MDAVIGTWTLEPGRWDAQVRGLHEQIVPLARQTPGFVSGSWVGDRKTGGATSTIVLENEGAARSFKSFVETDPETPEQAGVTLVSLTIVECFAKVHP